LGEVEGGGEGEVLGGGGDEGAGGEGEEGGAGLTGEVAEAVPRGGGDVVEFDGGGELEIEDEEGEVAVAEEEVGATEGFVGVVAADPEEAGAGGGAVGGGVEGVAAVDEGELGNVERRTLNVECRMLMGFGAGLETSAPRGAEELGEDEGEGGGGSGGGEFGEGAFGEGGEGGAEGGSFDGAGLVGVREFLTKLLPEILEVGGHLVECSGEQYSGGGEMQGGRGGNPEVGGRREWLAAAPEGFRGDRDSHLAVAAGHRGNYLCGRHEGYGGDWKSGAEGSAAAPGV
jgi:hypothetical protein